MSLLSAEVVGFSSELSGYRHRPDEETWRACSAEGKECIADALKLQSAALLVTSIALFVPAVLCGAVRCVNTSQWET